MRSSHNDKHRALLDAVFCVMAADGTVAKRERDAIVGIFTKMQAPLSEDEINRELKQFVERVRTSGRKQVLTQTVSEVASYAKTPMQRQAFLLTLQLVAEADGKVEEKESAVIERLRDALASSDSTPQPEVHDSSLLQPQPDGRSSKTRRIGEARTGSPWQVEMDQSTRDQLQQIRQSEGPPPEHQCVECGCDAASRGGWLKLPVLGDSERTVIKDACPQCGAVQPSRSAKFWANTTKWWASFWGKG